MIFSSITFIFYFLPLFIGFYFITGPRNAALLTGSVIFYTWGEGAYLFLLAALVLLNYFAGIWLGCRAGSRKARVLAAGIAANLLVLGFFKYLNFFALTFGATFGVTRPLFEMHLPLGISFFTFQLLSYLIDVSRGAIRADRDIVRFSTYIMMFPHLIAGPIVRYADINEELSKRSISVEKFGLGVQFFVVGLSQKVLIANTVAPAADKVFAMTAGELNAPIAWVGVVAYTLQIYFDFCGYSNMAIGLAFMLGFRFPRNFDYPYASRSVTEFWRRWHISLSFWFRDYVYFPLGGNRFGPSTTARNLLVVFLLTGLWHGAAWTFILWGLFHGAFLMAERAGMRKALDQLPPFIGHAYTLFAVMLGWVLFRASDLTQAASIVKAMIGLGRGSPTEPYQLWLTPEVILAMIVGIIFSFPVLPRILALLKQPEIDGPVVPGTNHTQVISVRVIPMPALLFGFVLSTMLLVGSSLNPFLYFRF